MTLGPQVPPHAPAGPGATSTANDADAGEPDTVGTVEDDPAVEAEPLGGHTDVVPGVSWGTGVHTVVDPAPGPPPGSTARPARPRRRPAVPAALVVIVLLVVVAQLPSVQGQLQAAGVLPRPAVYQSLYFVQPDALPRSMRSGPTILRPPVEVANTGPDTENLNWDVSVAVDGGPATIIGSGSIVVSPFSRADFSPQVQTECEQPRIYVAYRLQDTGKQIGFWVDCT